MVQTAQSLSEGLSKSLGDFLEYARSLDFSDKPDYEKMTKMLEVASDELKIDLNEQVFDWAIKAVILKEYPELYFKILSKGDGRLAGQFEHLDSQLKSNTYEPCCIFDKFGNLVIEIDNKLIKNIN